MEIPATSSNNCARFKDAVEFLREATFALAKAMETAITWSNEQVHLATHTSSRWRLAGLVLWQVAAASVAAFMSQMLIFDETNWYKIDLYDALTWGLVVTQVFTLSIYVSRKRVQSVENSLKIFLALATLSAGLTIAAIAFLVIDAVRSQRDVLPMFLISGGYWVAVFVFLVAMFLQLRFAIICVHAIRSTFLRKTAPSPQELGFEQVDGLGVAEADEKERYSIADIFAFTGLAAVSISAYRLVLGMVTDRDALRFLAMFYAASITAFFIYGLIHTRCSHLLKLLFAIAVVFIITYAEFYIAHQIRSPLLRFGFSGMLLCNVLIAAATIIQMWIVGRSEPSGMQLPRKQPS